MTSQVLRSVYEYESNDNKVLNFKINERFIVIKATKADDWVYCVNSFGQLGYVPNDYVEYEQRIEENEFLALIDSIAMQLDSKHNDNNVITDRQVKHAQIKLAQLRCEVVQLIFKKNNIQVIPELETNGSDCDLSPDTVNEKQIVSNDENVSKIGVNVLNGTHNNVENTSLVVNDVKEKLKSDEIKNMVTIPDILIPELIERVRVRTDLNHSLCVLTVKTVIECLSERIPEWSKDCETIIGKICANNDNPIGNVQSSDLMNMKSVFRKLWWCKNDEQQRSWPVHQDEDIIKGYLEELLQIISNANPAHIKEAIFNNNYENVHLLVTYYQMETRRSLRMKLYSLFISLISLFENIIYDYLLTSVMPAELAAEMQNYVKDGERWSSAALLFTAIFSTGHKPPINIYEHINEKFISQQLDLIEGIDSEGNRIESNISAENSIGPLLSFNLHFDESNDNLVLKALKNRRNASQLTENLVSYLNWEEDITQFWGTVKETHNDSHENPNSVLKLLIEMFENVEVSKLFYYNDVRVIIDIVIRQLNNLPVGDKSLSSYLILVRNVIKNSPFNEEPHKIDELSKCLKSIENHECSNDNDLRLISLIKAEQTSLFNNL